MSETGDETLQHYKKRLIQQHGHKTDPPIMIQKIDPKTLAPLGEEVFEAKRKLESDSPQAVKKRRKSRFKYEAMEFIKLGDANSSNTLCKSSVGKTMIKTMEQQQQQQGGEMSKAKLTEAICNTLAAKETQGRHSLPPVVAPQMRHDVPQRQTNVALQNVAPQNVEPVNVASPEAPQKNWLPLNVRPPQLVPRQHVVSPDVAQQNAVSPARLQHSPQIRLQQNVAPQIDVQQIRSPNRSFTLSPNFPATSPRNDIISMEQYRVLQMHRYRLSPEFYQNFDYNQIYSPLTPETSPTAHQHFSYQPRNFHSFIRPPIAPPEPARPMEDNTQILKRPRGRPRLHNLPKAKKPPQFFQNTIMSPPITPNNNAPFDLSLTKEQRPLQSPDRLRFSNDFGRHKTREHKPDQTQQELDKIIECHKKAPLTPETFTRLRLIYTNINKATETQKLLEMAKLLDSFQASFLSYCDDPLIKQLVPECQLFFRSFVHRLIVTRVTEGTWSYLGQIQVEQQTPEAPKNVQTIKQCCREDQQFFRKNYSVQVAGNGQLNEDVLFYNKQPSILTVVDKFGNYLETTYSTDDNILELKCWELIVLTETNSNEMRQESEAELRSAIPRPRSLKLNWARIPEQNEADKTKTEQTATKQNWAKTEQTVAKTEQNWTKTEQTAAKTQQSVANTLQNVAKTQQTVAKTQQTVAKTQQTVAKTEQLDQPEPSTAKVEQTASKPEQISATNECTDVKKSAGKDDVVIIIDGDDSAKEELPPVVTSTSSSHNIVIEDISDEEDTPPKYIKIVPNERLKISPTHKPVNYTLDKNNLPSNWDGVEGATVVAPPVARKSPEVTTSTRDLILNKINGRQKQLKPSISSKLPRGKLCYVRNKHMLLRYFDVIQANLYFENLEKSGKTKTKVDANNEVILLPPDVQFSSKETLDDVQEYLEEFNKVQAYIPKDFFSYYKYVSGYQIYKRNIPISFQTFLTMHNTNGLRKLMVSYIEQLERTELEEKKTASQSLQSNVNKTV